MQNVPKIVVDRLRAGSSGSHSAVPHPDADMLTAFAEHSLPAREGVIVVDHLAQCHACREIVMLALPAVDDSQVVILPPRAGWLTWPALRWGLAAAGIAVVASLGILRQEHKTRTVAMLAQKDNVLVRESQQQPSLPGATTLPAPAPEKTAGKDKAVAPLPAVAPASSVAETVAPKNGGFKTEIGIAEKSEPPLMARPAPSPAARMYARAGSIGGPYANAISNGQNSYNQNSLMQQQQAAQAQQNAAAMNVPHASETVEVTNAAPVVQNETVQDDQQAANAQLQARNQAAPAPSPPSDSLFDNSPGLVRAKPAMKAEFGPQWMVTATGGLQRSFDQGNSWQDVNVTANLSLPTNGRSYTELTTVSSASAAAKDKQQDVAKQKSSVQPSSVQSSSVQASAQSGLHKKSAIAALPVPVFRTVAANGGEVWAGGSNAALYHSADAGDHWTQIVPVAAGASLTGDVVRVEFTDAQHGKVSTSTAETWITSNNGQTWQKQ